MYVRCSSHLSCLVHVPQVCSTAFASLFFATRVAWMPYAIMELANNHPKKWKGLGLARYSLYPLCALQYYWFYRILLMLTRKR